MVLENELKLFGVKWLWILAWYGVRKRAWF